MGGSQGTIKTGLTEKFLLVNISDSQFAVPIKLVREVIGMGVAVPIASSPSHYKGMINLRGKVVTVIDLGLRLLGQAVKGRRPVVLIVELEGQLYGHLVDRVHEVCSFFAEQIDQEDGLKKISGKDFLLGVINSPEKGLICIVDIYRATDVIPEAA